MTIDEQGLRSLRDHNDLSILRLVEPIFAASAEQIANNRTSNASSTVSETARHPASIQQDLRHYTDLFAKLRFSYVEQVTKEKFLRAVTIDTPEIIDVDENIQLEASNAASKRALSEKKDDLKGMLSDLEAQGRQLAARYQDIEVQTAQLEMLPIEIEELESRIGELKSGQEIKSENPDLNLSLEETLALLAQREQEAADLDDKVDELTRRVREQEVQMEELVNDLEVLERRKADALAAVKATKSNNLPTEAEYQTRWLRSVEAGMTAMFDG